MSEARPALGPGDDDPKSLSRGTAAVVGGPLGPGDTDPRSTPGSATEIRRALGPGDDDGTANQRGTAGAALPPPGPGDGPESDVEMVALPPAGPGAIDTGARRGGLFRPKKKPSAPVVEESVPRAETSSTRRSRRNT